MRYFYEKKLIIIILIVILCCIGFLFYKSNSKNNSNYSSNYTAQKTSSSNNSISNESDNNSNNTKNNEKSETKKDNQNKVIGDFSTKLPKDTKARYSNIKLACETLDCTIVKSGSTFSLWNTLGCPTKEKGYKKAKAFTSDGKVKKSYGGWICQVSTTIYNALLEVDNIKITERHKYSRDVIYIRCERCSCFL